MYYKYEVALSFAGEDRNYVEEVAQCLTKNNITVFYDEFEESNLWGKDLYVYLDEIYRKESRYCIMFLSQHYARKLWTNHERESAQARAFQQNEEYILPVKLDNTEIPGIRPTIGYLNGKKLSPDKICSAILKKLNDKISTENLIENETSQQISVPKVKRKITDLEKKQFLKVSFTEMMEYFKQGLTELKKTNPHVETEFEKHSDSKIVTSVYVEGNLKAQCKIWIETSMLGQSLSILYSTGSWGVDLINDNSFNDKASVVDDGIELFFDILDFSYGLIPNAENIDLKHASPTDVARYLWARFIMNLNY